MPLQPGDICVSPAGWKPGAWIIIHEEPGPGQKKYHGVHLVTRKGYSLNERGLVKIGRVAEGFSLVEFLQSTKGPAPLPSEDNGEYLRGKERAAREAVWDQTDQRLRWEQLARAKPGDPIGVLVDGKAQRLRFHLVLPRGQKYVFAAETEAGEVFRFPLESLVADQPAAPGDRHGSNLLTDRRD